MKRCRGITVPELVVACFLLGLLMQLVVSTLSTLSFSKAGLLARTEPRQQLRSWIILVQDDLRSASYIFPQGSYDVLGTTVTTPGPGVAGNGVIFAVPETATSPVTYRICYAFTRPRQKPDTLNPEAYEAVYFYVNDVAPPGGSDLPAEIDPSTLTEGSLKVFDAYVNGPAGFKTEVTSTGYGVNFGVNFRRKPEKGDTTEQNLSTTIVLRNGL